jgi:hypothetical protein
VCVDTTRRRWSRPQPCRAARRCCDNHCDWPSPDERADSCDGVESDVGTRDVGTSGVTHNRDAIPDGYRVRHVRGDATDIDRARDATRSEADVRRHCVAGDTSMVPHASTVPLSASEVPPGSLTGDGGPCVQMAHTRRYSRACPTLAARRRPGAAGLPLPAQAVTPPGTSSALSTRQLVAASVWPPIKVALHD